MQNDDLGLWSVEGWTNTSMSFQRRTGNPFTTKKWPPGRGDPLRQNRRHNSLHHYLHSQRLLCRSISGSRKTLLPLTTFMRDFYPFLSFNVSKSMTRILRHRGLDREVDGAMEWDRLVSMLCRYYKEVPRWTNQVWIGHLHEDSNKKRFQYCLNSNSFIHYIVSSKVTLEETKLILHCWLTQKFRIIGVSTSITLVLLMTVIPLSNQIWLHEGRIRKKEDR